MHAKAPTADVGGGRSSLLTPEGSGEDLTRKLEQRFLVSAKANHCTPLLASGHLKGRNYGPNDVFRLGPSDVWVLGRFPIQRSFSALKDQKSVEAIRLLVEHDAAAP